MPEAHDPVRFATSLSAKLATRSRHVCAFLGAGVAKACQLPDIVGLQSAVLETLEGGMKNALEEQLSDRTLEQVLSRLRRISALVSGKQTVDGLSKEDAERLDEAICHSVKGALDVARADLTSANQFASWVARADYKLPVEIFTVNYDLLVETALEKNRVPYFDGFIGALEARFQTELVEAVAEVDPEIVPAFFARLWKLHGSVNWSWQSDRDIVRLGGPVPDGSMAAIYPSDTKYEESRRVPFVVLQDRFRRALNHPETLLIVAGYSFSDDHLNEMIFDAARRRQRSEFLAFCFDSIPPALAERAAVTPNLQALSRSEAIIGGIAGEWIQPDEEVPNIYSADGFAMHDFCHLAAYLARSTAPEEEMPNTKVSSNEGA